MKTEEKIAAGFLTEHFGTLPVYEPLGRNRPPDFSTNGLAFEVRRLNQQFSSNDGTNEGLEKVSFSVEKAVRSELAKIPFSESIGSFFYILSYERPLRVSASKVAKEIARQARGSYLAGTRATIHVEPVTLETIPAANSYGRAFLPGMINDWDSPGWVGDIYVKGIDLALREKIQKTGQIAERFSSWFLILIDTIMPDTDWTKEIGSPPFDLNHFSGIAVLTPNGLLSYQWPHDSVSRAFSL